MLGKIVYYGLATWDCFRVPPDHPSYLSLDEVVRLATKVGGARHGFRFVQLPVRGANSSDSAGAGKCGRSSVVACCPPHNKTQHVHARSHFSRCQASWLGLTAALHAWPVATVMYTCETLTS
jgi:hypothetical protein